MSLKAIAQETLARLRAGEIGHETEEETAMKQVKQPASVFHGASSCFTPMKHDLPQKSAISKPCFTVSFPRGGTDETSGAAWLPADIREGLNRLRTMRQPRITHPEVWPATVSDAGLIASGGWARMALALGWHLLDLFGCSADGDFEGLAVWLAGRRLVLIDEHSAIVAEGDRRSVFHRRGPDGAVFLWELGR